MKTSPKVITEYEEIYDNEKIENDKYKSMRELSKYTKLLNKQDNLFFILKNHEEIKLRNQKSLFKISMLLGELPEEIVSFTFYAEEDDEEDQSIEKSSKKLRGSKRISLSQSPQKLQAKAENKNQTKNETEIKPKNPATFYLLDNIKDSLALEIYKKGNIIGYDHNLFKKIWINLYILNLAISLIGLICVLYYSYTIIQDKKYLILGANGLSTLALILMIFTSFSGNNKMKIKKKVNFNKENWLLSIFILIAISCMGYFSYLYFNKNLGLPSYVVVFGNTIFGLLILISIALIYLNNKMTEFYKEYHQMEEEGTLLIEVQ